MQEVFENKIEMEYKNYQVSVLSGKKIEIYEKSYEIHTIFNLYEILLEQTEFIPEKDFAVLLEQENLLMELYSNWLKREDSNYRELENYVVNELESLFKRKAK